MRRRWFWSGLLVGLGLAGLRLSGLRLWRRTRGLDLAGKVVLITGASSGIGRAAAHAFAAQGARVVLVARRADVLARVQAELVIYGRETLVISADVTQDADLERIVTETLQRFCRIDVLVNNAGLSYGGPFPELAPDRLRALADVNLYGPLRLTQLVLPVMLRQGRDATGFTGQIVNVSSLAGLIASPGMAAYAGTRRGIVAFSSSLRRELDGTGIRVSVVLPTFTRTPMANRVPEGALRAAGAMWPLHGFDEPERPALAAVDAVRFNLRQVQLGGLQYRLGSLSERLTPGFLDFYWRIRIDTAAYIAAMRELGA